MSDNSKIEWPDATWQPMRGGSKISPGCLHGYAETFGGSAALSIVTAARGRSAKIKAAEQRSIVAHGVSRGTASVINH